MPTAEQVVKETIESWRARNTPERWRRDVLRALEENKEKLIFRLMGLRWNRLGKEWEIPPNIGSGSLARCLQGVVTDTAREWVEDNKDAFPRMGEGLVEEAKKTYKKQYEKTFLRMVESLARERAEEDANELIKETLAKMGTSILDEEESNSPPRWE